MISTSGNTLLPHASIKRLREELLPITTVLTPNVPEALYLLKDAGIEHEEPNCIDDMAVLAKAIQSLGPKWVLVKGGHSPFKKDGTFATEEENKYQVVDVLYGEGQTYHAVSDYQKSNNTHGTGCSLACESRFANKPTSSLTHNSRHRFQPRKWPLCPSCSQSWMPFH